MSLGLFLTALRSEEVEEVAMNEVRLATFYRATDKPCLGTQNLNSCTGVIIASQLAAILGHIAPRPPQRAMNDPDAGDRHMNTMMDRIVELYRGNQSLFPAEKPSWVVSAIWEEGLHFRLSKPLLRRSCGRSS
ncbi:hypothetical protein BDV97DRAFT_186865 [Delphinella strobiligena]|nr:hypothetical protein BDV97DRAFT_186865 [Delphinella strobiligena]